MESLHGLFKTKHSINKNGHTLQDGHRPLCIQNYNLNT